MPKTQTNLIRKPDFKIIYAIGAIGSWTPHDFRINFYSEKVPDENTESYVNDAQVILTPTAAKEFALWLMQNVQEYERTVGKELESGDIEIKTIDDRVAEIRKDIENELKDDLRKKIEKELKTSIKNELTKELENSIKTQLAKDLASKPRTMKLKKALKQDLQKDLQKDLKKDLKEDIKRDIAQDLKKDIKTAIPPVVQTELKKVAKTTSVASAAKKPDGKKVTRRRRTVKK